MMVTVVVVVVRVVIKRGGEFSENMVQGFREVNNEVFAIRCKHGRTNSCPSEPAVSAFSVGASCAHSTKSVLATKTAFLRSAYPHGSKHKQTTAGSTKNVP